MKTFISSKETARRLAINYTTLIRWRNKQQGPPAYRIGKMWKYDEAEVAAYIQSCRHQPPDQPPSPVMAPCSLICG